MSFLHHIKPGDYLTFVAGITCIVWLSISVWTHGTASTALIRSGGKVFREVPLSRDQEIAVPGPLGTSLIIIEKQRVRIKSDPSPRQYCVRQGWIQRPGEITICLPNEVSVELTGGEKPYDSLNY